MIFWLFWVALVGQVVVMGKINRSGDGRGLPAAIVVFGALLALLALAL